MDVFPIRIVIHQGAMDSFHAEDAAMELPDALTRSYASKNDLQMNAVLAMDHFDIERELCDVAMPDRYPKRLISHWTMEILYKVSCL